MSSIDLFYLWLCLKWWKCGKIYLIFLRSEVNISCRSSFYCWHHWTKVPILASPDSYRIDVTFVISSFLTSFLRLQHSSSSDFSIMLLGNEAIILSAVFVVILLCGCLCVMTIVVAIICYWYHKVLWISLLAWVLQLSNKLS